MERNKIDYNIIKEIADRYGIGIKIPLDKDESGFIFYDKIIVKKLGINNIYKFLNGEE